MGPFGAAVAALFTIYFPLAAWINHSYVDLVPKGTIVVQLIKPFEAYDRANVSHQDVLSKLSQWADDEKAEAQRSPVVVYEDGVPLGPGHNTFGDIARLGAGRYAHWRSGVVFSASDDSDPNRNGRNYWAVLPDIKPEPAKPVPKGKVVVELHRPFETYEHAAVSRHAALEQLSQWADDDSVEAQRSPIVIYEDGVALGPGHNPFAEIARLGSGRYAHWQRSGLAFSASDNSDPNTNGRTYWAVLPDEDSRR
jgi:hypothetical protein